MEISEYCAQLKAGGCKAVGGSENTVWVSHERFSMVRQPAFALHVPHVEEIKNVFRRSHAAMLAFAVKASDVHAVNSSLYICTDPEYSLKKLGRGARYDTSRGLNELEIKFVEQSQLLRLGRQAYCDTLARTGLSVDSREPFEVSFARLCNYSRCLGALKGDRLAAFLLVTEVGEWVSIAGYSADEFLALRPNNALIFYALRHYLVEQKFRVVSYGLSSIQANSKAEGLHKFKLKMGFESVPVHRVFTVNPLLRPFVNRASWALVNGMLKMAPDHPILKKAEGALRMALQSYD
jgi:hypothetical protein